MENDLDEFGELYADVLPRFPSSSSPSLINPRPVSYSSAKYPLVEDPRIEHEQSSLFGSGAGKTQVADHQDLPITPDFGPEFDCDEIFESDDDEKAEMGADGEMGCRGLDGGKLGENSDGTRVLMGNEGFDVGFGEREEVMKIGDVDLNADGDPKDSGEEESLAQPVQGHSLQKGGGRLDDLDFDPSFIELLTGSGDTVPGNGADDFYEDSDTRAFDPSKFYGIGEMEERDSDSEDDMEIILNNHESSGCEGLNQNGNVKDLYSQGEELADGEGKQQCDEEKETTKLGDAWEMTIQSQDHSRRSEVEVSKSMVERSTQDVKGVPSLDNPSVNVTVDANVGRAISQPWGPKFAGSAQRVSSTVPGGSAWGFSSSKLAPGVRVDFRLLPHMKFAWSDLILPPKSLNYITATQSSSTPASWRIFNVNVDDFEDKPWILPGVDFSDYFNFGMDELKWKVYCRKMVQLCWENSTQNKRNVYASERRKQTQRIGRAIQVQVGIDEQLPSNDSKQPRLSDSGVIIEIVIQDPSNEGGAETKDTKVVSQVGTSTALSTKGHKNIHGNEIQPFPLDSTPQFFSDIEHDNTKHLAEERETQSSESTDDVEEGEIMADKVGSGATLDEEESLNLSAEKPRRSSQFERPSHYASDGENFSWSVRNTRKYIGRPEMRGGGTRGRGVKDDFPRHRTQFDGIRYRHKRNINEREDNNGEAYFPPGKKLGDHGWRNNGRNYDNSMDRDDYSRDRRRNVDYGDEDGYEEEKINDGNYKPWKDFDQRKRENFNYPGGQRRIGQPRMRYRGNLQHSDGYQKRKGWPNGKFGEERFDQPHNYNHYNNPSNERRSRSYNNNFSGDGGGFETRWLKIDGEMMRRKRGNYQRNQILTNPGC